MQSIEQLPCRCHLVRVDAPGERWDVYLAQAGVDASAIGRERFESLPVARRYAKELMALYRIATLEEKL